MKRRTSAKSVKIYSYGCLPPSVGGVLVELELRRASQFYNRLVEIERARVAGFREARAEVSPELTLLEEQLVDLESQIELACAEVKAKAPESVAKLAGLKAARKGVSVRAKEQRSAFLAVISPAQKAKAARAAELCPSGAPRLKERANAQALAEMLDGDWPDIWKRVAINDAKAEAAVKAARLEYKTLVGAGTRGLAENSFASAKRDSVDVRFRRHDGTGRIGGQVRKARAHVESLGDNGVMQLRDGLPKTGRDGRVHPPNPRYKIARVYLGEGVGSDSDRWAEFPVKMHRELPADSAISLAWILVTRNGNRLRYELQLTLETEETKQRPSGTGTATVRLGWARSDSGGLRAGTYVGSDGTRGDVELPESVVARLNLRENSLRKISDQHYVGKSETGAERKGRPRGGVHPLAARAVRLWARWGVALPSWITEPPTAVHGKQREPVIAAIGFWKAHWKLREMAKRLLAETRTKEESEALWRTWRNERKWAGLDLFAPLPTVNRWLIAHKIECPQERLAFYLDWWRRKDEHLEQWGADSVSRARGNREQIYRQFAIGLAGKYERVVIHDVELAKLARKPAVDEDRKSWTSLRSQQRDAAPSELRAALLDVFGKDRCDFVKPGRERSGGDDSLGGARGTAKTAEPKGVSRDDSAPREHDGRSAAE